MLKGSIFATPAKFRLRHYPTALGCVGHSVIRTSLFIVIPAKVGILSHTHVGHPRPRARPEDQPGDLPRRGRDGRVEPGHDAWKNTSISPPSTRRTVAAAETRAAGGRARPRLGSCWETAAM